MNGWSLLLKNDIAPQIKTTSESEFAGVQSTELEVEKRKIITDL